MDHGCVVGVVGDFIGGEAFVGAIQFGAGNCQRNGAQKGDLGLPEVGKIFFGILGNDLVLQFFFFGAATK